MPKRISGVRRCAVVVSLGLCAWSGGDETSETFFENTIRPILVSRCVECHGPDAAESELRLDSREAFLAGGARGEALVNAENPDAGLLRQAIRHENDLEMPPSGKLPDEELAAIEKWISAGAPWPESSTGLRVAGIDERRVQDRAEHWAYQPIARPPLPDVKDAERAATAVDRYLLAKLEDQGLSFAPEADRYTLLRRASFDLLGLPPTYEEVRAFEQDGRPDAWERAVDRLLASPRLGERWGRHWLDVARYADTSGYAFERDNRYPYAFTYRDYVVRSMNEDLPYDRFVREQLAADLLPDPRSPKALAALGFLTVGRDFNDGQDNLDDKIDVVSRGLLGLTVSCARCHDHKYDAIAIGDYYSWYGIFASSRQPEEMPLIVSEDERGKYAEFFAVLAERKKETEDLERTIHREIVDQAYGSFADYVLRTQYDLPAYDQPRPEGLTLEDKDVRRRLLDRYREWVKAREHDSDSPVAALAAVIALPEEEFPAKRDELLANWRKENESDGDASPVAALRATILERFAAKPPERRIDAIFVAAKACQEMFEAARVDQAADGKASETPVSAPAPVVERFAELARRDDFPGNVAFEQSPEYRDREDRNRLTEVIRKLQQFEAGADDPPPRAMVLEQNGKHDPRIFKRGNVGSPGDPVPRQFIPVVASPEAKPYETGGRLELAGDVTSPANPLTARVVANRVWMHHFGEPLVDSPSDFGVRTARPVQAELLDYLAWRLIDSGWSLKSLHRELMTSGAYRQSHRFDQHAFDLDPENRLLWRGDRRRLEWEPLRDAMLVSAGRLESRMYGKAVDIFRVPYTGRRSLYAFIDRQALPQTFRAFDLASPDQSSARRPETIVPQQALFLMNSPFAQNEADGLRDRVLAAASSPEHRVTTLFRLALSRDPSPSERELCAKFLEGRAEDAGVWSELCQSVLMSSPFLFLD